MKFEYKTRNIKDVMSYPLNSNEYFKYDKWEEYYFLAKKDYYYFKNQKVGKNGTWYSYKKGTPKYGKRK